MGAVDLWSHPAYFDYVDRCVGPNSCLNGDTGNYGAVYGFGGQCDIRRYPQEAWSRMKILVVIANHGTKNIDSFWPGNLSPRYRSPGCCSRDP